MKGAFSKNIYITYLLLLGVCIGVELSVGVLVAPVIFYPTQFLGDGILTHFQSGILMTQIFLRFNIIFIFITIFLLIYEAYAYFVKRGDILSSVLVFLILCCAILFVLYYTPFIVEAQAIGAEATASEKFTNMHKGSEIVLKIAVIGQIALFFRRVWIELKNKCSS